MTNPSLHVGVHACACWFGVIPPLDVFQREGPCIAVDMVPLLRAVVPSLRSFVLTLRATKAPTCVRSCSLVPLSHDVGLSHLLTTVTEGSRKSLGGVFILGIVFVLFWIIIIFFAFGFLAFRLLGFSASWLLGFSASRLLGFWAFAAFRWFMRHLAAFGGFGFSHPAGFLAIGFWIWLPASSASPPPSSDIMGGGTPPTHPLLFRLFAE